MGSATPWAADPPRPCRQPASVIADPTAAVVDLDAMSIDLLFQDVTDLLGSLATAQTPLPHLARFAPLDDGDSPAHRGRTAQTDGDADPLLRQIDDVLRLLSDDSLSS